MKQAVFAIVLLTIIVLLAAGGAFADPKQETGGKGSLYKSAQFGFEMEVGGNWKHLETSDDSETFEIGDREAHITIGVNSKLSAEELLAARANIGAFGKEVCTTLTQQNKNLALVESGEITLGGAPAYRYSWDTDIDTEGGRKVPTRFMQILIPGADRLYLLQIATRQEDYPRLLKNAMKYFETLKMPGGGDNGKG